MSSNGSTLQCHLNEKWACGRFADLKRKSSLIAHAASCVRDAALTRCNRHHSPIRSLKASITGRNSDHPAITSLQTTRARGDCSHPSIRTLQTSATGRDGDHPSIGALKSAPARRNFNHSPIRTLQPASTRANGDHVSIAALETSTAIWDRYRLAVRTAEFPRHRYPILRTVPPELFGPFCGTASLQLLDYTC